MKQFKSKSRLFGAADAFVDQRLALGRVAFPLADLINETGLSVTAARNQLLRLGNRVTRVSPRHQFFLIVIAKRGLSFAELSRVEAGHLDRLLAGEMQWAMMRMFQQYDAIANLLLPTALIPKHKSARPVASSVAEPSAELNFGD